MIARILVSVVGLAISVGAAAQQNGPRNDRERDPREGQPQPQPQFNPGPGGNPGTGPMGPGPGPGSPGNRGVGVNVMGNPALMQVEAMRSWLELIERYTRMSRDPVTSGVAAVVGANDLMRNRPAEEAIAYFEKLLPDVKNEAVQRAIRLQLIELYGKANLRDKAMEQLRQLMVTPGTEREKREE